MKKYKPDTTCIHAGYTPGNGEPRVVPIVQKIGRASCRERV